MENEKEYYETKASEDEYLAWYKKQDWKTYDKPAMAVDNVIFGFDPSDNQLKILLIERKTHPFKGKFALIGGFVEPNESAKEAALRETKEETGVEIVEDNQMWQIGAFTQPDRDPRQWIISIAHATFLYPFVLPLAGDDARSARWFTVARNSNGELEFLHPEGYVALDDLAFDHKDIILTTFKRIKDSLDVTPDILHVLGDTFFSTDALGVLKNFDKKFVNYSTGNFVKTYVKNNPILMDTGKFEKNPKGAGRPKKILSLRK
ncbi:NUDIX domain-containing protein [Lactococcus nasutitermitis]|uniref:NUDIX domain-containing protein n=1 Tax=Lactococcus nasutitermitis TaxID=1652957 RepID=A0ABV9JDZ1_9LACT|nr:NUDIX hydrolase [Lactococcus nasutitermitis]